MTTIEFQILELARDWQPSLITADEIARQLRRNNFRVSRQAVAGRARSMRSRGLLTAHPCSNFHFYSLTPKAEAILDV